MGEKCQMTMFTAELLRGACLLAA